MKDNWLNNLGLWVHCLITGHRPYWIFDGKRYIGCSECECFDDTDSPKLSNLCDRCKENPKPFEAGPGPEGEEKITCHYLVIKDGETEPLALMSNGEIMWALYVPNEHPIGTGDRYLCSACVDALEKGGPFDIH